MSPSWLDAAATHLCCWSPPPGFLGTLELVDAADPNSTDILQVVFVGLQLVVLVAAAIFARRQLNEAKQLREEQTRPFVVLDLESEEPPFFFLAVKNIGTTMARDVRFEFDPPAESTIDHANLDNLKMFREGISTLPPGKEIKTLFDSAIQRHPAQLPEVYDVRVRYTDQERRKQYSETMDLDFGLYWGRLSITRRGIHHVHEELQRMRKEMKKWSPNLGSGLLLVSEEDMEKRIANAERKLEEPHRLRTPDEDAEDAKGTQEDLDER